jgi:glycosyltransferase involved in cell wall biosynthesis
VQNKVLEAMAMAKAVVASPQALEGIEAIPGEHLLTASTRAEWAEAIVHLHENPAHRQRLGSAARRFVEAHHRWANCLEPMSELLGIGPVHANGSHASSNDQR